MVNHYQEGKVGERQHADGLGVWTKAGKELEGIRSARLGRVRSVQPRVLFHAELREPAVSVFPDSASETVKR